MNILVYFLFALSGFAGLIYEGSWARYLKLFLGHASYGQVFGDQVLCDVAKFLIQERDDRIGECCGRMDGELFMCVLRADSELEAFARAERIREGIAALRWNRFPDASVTVSGCFIACGNRNYSHFSQFLVKAEEVLYLAKTEGRNKIRKMS